MQYVIATLAIMALLWIIGAVLWDAGKRVIEMFRPVRPTRRSDALAALSKLPYDEVRQLHAAEARRLSQQTKVRELIQSLPDPYPPSETRRDRLVYTVRGPL